METISYQRNFQFDDRSLDEEILTGMSIQLGWEKEELRAELLSWKYNALTATYALLLVRRYAGRNYTRIGRDSPTITSYLKI